jgi:hypothetical protein
MASIEEVKRLQAIAAVREAERKLELSTKVTKSNFAFQGRKGFQSRIGSPDENLKLTGEQLETMGREATIIAGSQTGAVIGVNLPLPPNMRALAGIAGAGIGGTLATFGFDFGGAVFEGQDLGDIDFGNLTATALSRGGEELFFEATGQGLVRGFDLAKDTLKTKFLMSTDNQKLAMDLLDRSGDGLSLGRATDSALLKFVDDSLRSTPATSKLFDTLDIANETAFRNLIDQEITHIAGQELSQLAPNRVGILAIDALKGGSTLLSSILGRHYTKLDDLVPHGLVQRSVEDKFAGGTKTLSELVPPVDTTKAVEFANGELNNSVTKRIAQTEEGKRVIDDLSSLKDNPRLSFSDAHKLRSDILALKRSVPLDAVNRDQAIRLIDKADGLVTEAMDSAVTQFGTPTAKRHLGLLNKEWKQNKETFNNEFIAKIFGNKTTPSKIGDWIFASDAPPERIQAVYKALDKAQGTSIQIARREKTASKGLGFSTPVEVVNADAIKRRLQGQYFRSRLTMDTDLVGNSDLFKILDNRSARDTFEAAIPDKEHQDVVLDLLKAVRISGGDTLTTGGRTIAGIQMTRAALAVGGAAVIGTGALAGGSAAPEGSGAEGGLGGAVLTLGTIVIGTRQLSKIFTNPKLVRKLVSAAKIPATSPTAGSVIARLSSEITQFLQGDLEQKNLRSEAHFFDPDSVPPLKESKTNIGRP